MAKTSEIYEPGAAGSATAGGGGRHVRGLLGAVWAAKLHLQRVIIAAAGVILSALIVVQVVSRYILNASVFGIEELASYVAVWLYFMGASLATWERGHISASLVDVIIPHGRAQAAVNAVTALISVVLSGWMTVWAVEYLLWSASRGAMSMELDIPLAWVHAAIPTGLALMTLYFVVEFLDRLRELKKGGAR